MDYTALASIVGALSSPAQILVTVIICFIIFGKLIEYNEYKIKRKHKTIRNTLVYVEAVLKNIKSTAIENMKNIMTTARNGVLSDLDKYELSACRLVLTDSLDIQTKHHIKEIFLQNGYYKRIKNKDDISDIKRMRTTELRNISAEAVDGVLRDSSPLKGIADKRFSYDDSEKLLTSILEKHVFEIDDEITDINNKAIELFGKLSMFVKYSHED